MIIYVFIELRQSGNRDHLLLLPQAEHVVVTMGSSAETLRATAAHLNAQGERVGVLQVLLYRPWSAKDFLAEGIREVASLVDEIDDYRQERRTGARPR